MRYFKPLLPPGEIFQSNSSSKSVYSSLLNKSSVIFGCGLDFKQPSSMVQASPAGVLARGSSQCSMVLPSKSKTQPDWRSSEVRELSAARDVNTTMRRQKAALKNFIVLFRLTDSIMPGVR